VFFKRWFGPNPTVKKGRSLYAAAVAQARNPVFYRNLAVPDTTEGRFELYSLHVVLLLHRLKGHGPQAQDIGQALFAAYVQALDSALREMGVGDLSMAKKMRKLGEAFYGRIKAYDSALLALPDQSELEAVVGRTLYADVKDAPVGLICQYAVAGVAGLSDQDITGALDPVWPPIPVAGKETV
jgi:cytochrome b pre-mRNA-processing protein 3